MEDKNPLVIELDAIKGASEKEKMKRAKNSSRVLEALISYTRDKNTEKLE